MFHNEFSLCFYSLTDVLLALLGLFCISSGLSLLDFLDEASFNFKLSSTIWGLLGTLKSRTSAWAAEQHPVLEISLLWEHPPWFTSQSGGEAVTRGALELQVLTEVREAPPICGWLETALKTKL
ncbi:hypothetical protein AMECASPLE_034866 [Ameca splendens]|uniref:Uncharacterized protein n=1 Tax=Ameca splendens TaxID=208324 RepID=A0ABV0XKG3_9TELE